MESDGGSRIESSGSGGDAMPPPATEAGESVPAEPADQGDGSGFPADVKAQADAAVAGSRSFFAGAEASPDRSESNRPSTDPPGKAEGRGR
jgi:hypothetical protein